MNIQDYFYRDKAGREIGPLSLDTLAKFRFAGVLDGDSPVRASDAAEWKPCREIIADFTATSSAAPASVGLPSVKSNSALPGWMYGTLITIALVLFMAWPSFQKARQAQSRIQVMNALRQIDAAKCQWALENQKGLSAIPTENDLLPFLAHGSYPKHPSGGSFVINAVKDDPQSTTYGKYDDTNSLSLSLKVITFDSIRKIGGD